MEKILGYKIKRDLNNITLNISQSHLISKLTQVFNDEVKSLMTLNTPMQHTSGLYKKKETGTNISKYLQKRYRSGVWSIPHIVKYSWLELSNAVRELSKCMDESNMSQYKALLREINDVIDTKDSLYQMKPEVTPNGPWELRGYIKTDYTGDNET